MHYELCTKRTTLYYYHTLPYHYSYVCSSDQYIRSVHVVLCIIMVSGQSTDIVVTALHSTADYTTCSVMT
mgnify:CR=1 FL=1